MGLGSLLEKPKKIKKKITEGWNNLGEAQAFIGYSTLTSISTGLFYGAAKVIYNEAMQKLSQPNVSEVMAKINGPGPVEFVNSTSHEVAQHALGVAGFVGVIGTIDLALCVYSMWNIYKKLKEQSQSKT